MDKKLRPLLGIFIAVACAAALWKHRLTAAGVDVQVVQAANVLLMAVSLLTHIMYQRAMGTDSPHGFVRKVSGTFIIKFVVLASAALCYFYFSEAINKPAIIICAALYLVYNFISTAQVVKRKQAQQP
ncbi:MAG: hypothetical protein EAY75_02540 [Bacteroidetes bacterium]|nr:MAG: hypothetical protein EAY75_02540 [Bacteroidota bacterium]